MLQSKRVEAVKQFATEHYEENGWDIVVETYSDLDIYNVVKHQLSEEGAIKKMAKHIGARADYRQEIVSLSGESHNSTCGTCGKEVHSLAELNDHGCSDMQLKIEKPEGFDPKAPNGYFKNGKPKPVSKAKLAELQAAGLVAA